MNQSASKPSCLTSTHAAEPAAQLPRRASQARLIPQRHALPPPSCCTMASITSPSCIEKNKAHTLGACLNGSSPSCTSVIEARPIMAGGSTQPEPNQHPGTPPCHGQQASPAWTAVTPMSKQQVKLPGAHLPNTLAQLRASPCNTHAVHAGHASPPHSLCNGAPLAGADTSLAPNATGRCRLCAWEGLTSARSRLWSYTNRISSWSSPAFKQ